MADLTPVVTDGDRIRQMKQRSHRAVLLQPGKRDLITRTSKQRNELLKQAATIDKTYSSNLNTQLMNKIPIYGEIEFKINRMSNEKLARIIAGLINPFGVLLEYIVREGVVDEIKNKKQKQKIILKLLVEYKDLQTKLDRHIIHDDITSMVSSRVKKLREKNSLLCIECHQRDIPPNDPFCGYCDNCNADIFQHRKQSNKTDSLLKCVNAFFVKGEEKLCFLGSIEIDVEGLLCEYTEAVDLKEKSIKSFVANNVRYDCISVDGGREHGSAVKNEEHPNRRMVEGSRFPVDYDFDRLREGAFCCNTKHPTLITLSSNGDDFLFIHPEGGICVEDVIELSESEMSPISNLVIAGRAGASGGCVTLDTNSHWLSKCTKGKETKFIGTKGDSVSMKVLYRNRYKAKKSVTIYNDILCSRYSKNDKKTMMKDPNNGALRRITIKEMEARLLTLLVCLDCDLIPQNVNRSNILKTFDTHWKEDTTNVMVKEFRSLGYDKFESVLLSWACTSGEMRNHEALAAHVDGNKSHFLETLSLFPRIYQNAKQVHQRSDEIMGDVNSGLLIFPFEGFALKIYCGRTIINCHLKHTVHIPDNSRNTKNWSRVYGPN